MFDVVNCLNFASDLTDKQMLEVLFRNFKLNDSFDYKTDSKRKVIDLHINWENKDYWIIKDWLETYKSRNNKED